MAQINATVSLTYRHRWLGRSFMWLAAVPVWFGMAYSDAAMNRIVDISYRLMGPKFSVA